MPSSKVLEDLEATPCPDAPAVPKPSVRLGRILDDLRDILFHPTAIDGLAGRIDALASELSSCVAKDADQALFLVQRHWPAQHAVYSVLHAARCAIACDLVARRLAWPQKDAASLVRAALTMNIAITELQGTLALRTASQNKPSGKEAEAIAAHPARSAAILRSAGVEDAEWLQAVEQHHERGDGSGYPTRTREASRLARALRCVDEFFAKVTARASRPALPLRQAAREVYRTNEDGRPIVEALIAEFGLYPPGTFVRLANGDLGVVLRRGRRINAPLAVALANRKGERLGWRVRRDTSDTRYAIVMASNH
jgi:HD-GYP domain-containing protein (c-di-GMP phosphodiesterase class II)